MKEQNSLQKLDSILLALLVFTMCGQMNVMEMGPNTLKLGFATKQLFIAVCDVVLLLSFGWFFLRTTQLKAWRRLWWPPLPCWALIIAMVIAALHAPILVNTVAAHLAEAQGPKAIIKALIGKESKEAIAEIVQFTGYFLIAPLMLVNLIHDRRFSVVISRRRLALHAFTGALFLATLIAFFEMLTHREEIAPNALFGSPNAYAGFIALALPFAVAHVLSIWNKPLPPFITTLLTVVFAALTLVSPFAVVAAMIGILVAGALMRQMSRAFIVLGVFLVATLGGWAATGSLQPLRQDYLSAMSSHEPKPGEKRDVKKQFIEWYAALGWSRPRPVPDNEAGERNKSFATGVAPGNYQQNIGPYYDTLPNEEKMPPDSNNLYLVQAVAIGALGLGALLWMAFHFAGEANRARRLYPKDWLGAGVLASLASAAFVNLFHALLVRGTALVLALLFSLAIVALLEGDVEH